MQKIISLLVVLLIVSTTVSAFSQDLGVIRTEKKMVEQSIEYDDGLMDSSWPMFKHDVRHTGLSEYDTSHNPGGERWKFEVMEGTQSSPAIDKNGTIYFGSEDNKLYAIYPNGTEKWNCSTGGWAFRSSPALASDGTIYITTWTNGKVLAINPNGTIKWKFKQDDYSASPSIGTDGTVYIGSLDGRLYALHSVNGTLKWKFDINNTMAAVRSPAIGDDGTIYVTSFNSKLYALAPSGSLKWTFDTPGQFYSAPVIGDDGTIYITPSCGYLYAVNPNGTEKWRAKTTSGYLVTPALGPDGTIYVQGGFNVMDAFYPNGNKKWSLTVTESPEAIYSTPSVGNDGIVYIGVDGHLLAINPDGTIKWKTRLTSDRQPYDICHIDSSPAIAEDGTIYIGTWFLTGGSGVTDWGYLHAIGGGKVLNIDEGYLYVFGNRILKTPFGRTIILGNIKLQIDFFHPENLEKAELLIDDMIRCTMVAPPFEYTIDSLLIGRHSLEIRGYYKDDTISSEKMKIFFFIL